MNQITIFDYDRRGNRSKGVSIGDLIFYFSYETLVGFFSPRTGTIVMKNYWSATTGHHLNSIDGGDKKRRLSDDEFDKQVNQELEKIDLLLPSSPA